jgi:hypothetical protein
MFMELAKPVAGYAATAALTWFASRYHLTGDQVTAITMDLGAAIAAAGGVYAHRAAFLAPSGGKA